MPREDRDDHRHQQTSHADHDAGDGQAEALFIPIVVLIPKG